MEVAAVIRQSYSPLPQLRAVQHAPSSNKTPQALFRLRLRLHRDAARSKSLRLRVLSMYSELGELVCVMTLFKMIREDELLSNEFTYAVVLSTCARMSDVKIGRQAHCVLIKVGWGKSSFREGSLIDMYGTCRVVADARWVFDCATNPDMVSWTAMIANPNVVAWNVMISGHAQKGLESKALDLYVRMRKAGVKPTRSTFGSVLSAIAGLRALDYGSLVTRAFTSSNSSKQSKFGIGLDRSISTGSSRPSSHHDRASVPDLWNRITPPQDTPPPTSKVSIELDVAINPSNRVEVSKSISNVIIVGTIANHLKTFRTKSQNSLTVALKIKHSLIVGYAEISLLFRSPSGFFKLIRELRQEDYMSSYFVLSVTEALLGKLSRVNVRNCFQVIDVIVLTNVCLDQLGCSISTGSFCSAAASLMLGNLEIIDKVATIAMDLHIRQLHRFNEANDLVDFFTSKSFDLQSQQAGSEEPILCQLSFLLLWILDYIFPSLCLHDGSIAVLVYLLMSFGGYLETLFGPSMMLSYTLCFNHVVVVM